MTRKVPLLKAYQLDNTSRIMIDCLSIFINLLDKNNHFPPIIRRMK
nr:MAG TPA: hypothetical protein [Caudoviricetes sp.]